jgi:hypothetical protein
MGERLPKFAVPAFVATIAGIGLDLMGNTLAQFWPNAPALVWSILFYASLIMILAFPVWVAWTWGRHLLGRTQTASAEICIECRGSTLPSHVPAGGFFFFDLVTVLLELPQPQIIPISHSARQPGEPLGWEDFDKIIAPPWACEVTNFTTAPMFNVVLELKVQFREVVTSGASPGVTSSGSLVAERRCPILINTISPGDSGKFRFYIYNQTDYFGFTIMPDKLIYQTIGSDVRRAAKIMHVGHRGTVHGPRTIGK